MSAKVSILIPLYRTERYIVRAAHSLLMQSYHNCEFIFVDDGSPDRTVELLEELIESEFNHLRERISIIKHTTNQGVAAARNTLLEAATGDYITFVDSDDWVERDMVAASLSLALASEADIVRFASMDHLLERSHYTPAPWVGDARTSLCAILEQSHLMGNHITRLLIRRPLIEGLQFVPGVNMAEDYAFISQLLYIAKRIIYTPRPLYHYRLENPDSYSNNLNRTQTLSYIAANGVVTEFFRSKSDGESFAYSLELGKLNIKKWVRKRGFSPREFDHLLFDQPISRLSLRLYNAAIEHAPIPVMQLFGAIVNLPILIRVTYLNIFHYLCHIKDR
ncbi:MAG: glycosyltransferase family 2 protein [Rikenellaceae bacterium]